MFDENATPSQDHNASGLAAEAVEAATFQSATSDTQVGDAPDSSQNSVEAAGPATIDVKENKAPDSLPPEAKAIPPSLSKGVEKDQELRFDPRIRVRWHADVIIDGQGVQHGFIKDISLSGTNIFIERNFQKVKFVKLRIYVPPLSKSSSPQVMEISAKVTYTSYDSNESIFRAGVSFSQFNLESDREYLRSRIASNPHAAS